MIRILLLACLAGWLAGCNASEAPGPPVLHFGSDVCDVCGMIISDERFAAAVVEHDDRGKRRPKLFDDLGCMLGYEDDGSHGPIVERYVRNADGSGWLEATTAVFVHNPDLHTPMGFGVAACPDDASTTTFIDERGGDRLDLEGVRHRLSQGELVKEPDSNN